MEMTSWRDGLLVGVPMVAVLLGTFFRLDEVWSRREKDKVRRPLAGGVDGNGMPICLDPDGEAIGRFASHEEFRHWQRLHRPADWVRGVGREEYGK